MSALDEALLVIILRSEAYSPVPAPAMMSGLLKDPEVAARVRDVLEATVHKELLAQADDATGA